MPSRVELELSWTQIGAFRPRAGGTKSIVVDPADAGATTDLAVYRFDFVDDDGTLVRAPETDAGGGDCYVGETTNLRNRLETYRYGRGLHGRLLRRRLVRHFERHSGGAVEIFIVDQCQGRVDGEVVVSMTSPEQAADAIGGHNRLLFEQAAILAMQHSGRQLINVAPELRQTLAAEARAVAAKIKRSRLT